MARLSWRRLASSYSRRMSNGTGSGCWWRLLMSLELWGLVHASSCHAKCIMHSGAVPSTYTVLYYTLPLYYHQQTSATALLLQLLLQQQLLLLLLLTLGPLIRRERKERRSNYPYLVYDLESLLFSTSKTICMSYPPQS